MAGLFDTTNDPAAAVMQRRQQANQALGSPYGKYAGIVQAGGMFADTGADAIAGGGYGSADPTMAKSIELKKIAAVVAQQFPGKTDTPDYYKALALAVQDKYPEKAKEAMDMAAKKEQEAQQAKLTGLQTQQAELGIKKTQAELAAAEKAATKETQRSRNQVNAVKALYPNADPELQTYLGENKDLFDKLMEAKFTDPKKQTQIATVGNNVVLVDKSNGNILKTIGAAPPRTSTIINNQSDDISKLKTASDMMTKDLQDSSDALGILTNAKQLISSIRQGSKSAVPQLRRVFARLTGPDASISQVEIKNILGSAGIPADVVNSLVMGLTGTLTEGKLKDLENLVNTLEQGYIKTYNSKYDALVPVIDSSTLSDAGKKSLKERFKRKIAERKVVRRGTDKATGRKVVQYDDGKVEYAD